MYDHIFSLYRSKKILGGVKIDKNARTPRTPKRFSKHLMQDILLQNDVVKETLPETEKLSEKSLWSMLYKHQEIILKKENYGKGIGMLKVKVLEEGNYEVHIEDEKKIITQKTELNSYVMNITNGEDYLVQQFVALAKINDSPFDIRVIVQRKFGTNKWIVTGKYAKVSQQDYFKTNLAAGGSVLPVDEAIRLSSVDDNIDISTLLSQIDEVSLEATKQACSTETFKDWLIWGMDVGIENNGKLVFFEANEVPGYKGFKNLPDLTMRKRIRKIKAYNLKMKNKKKG
ncbi:YheC/YheD family protein [Paenisporosarcina sp. TG20]|uniref:YheC/YheD family protein n=1 Tax=Paenisporosarcina sp. TG20 TaxID=1211706 RepID=UPI002100F581|nr:YheC/YheD family protein [Paenisporosarcina sp. TG20]